MKKSFKRLLSMVLCLAMCLSMSVVYAAGPELMLVLDTQSAEVGNLPSTIKMTIKTSEELDIASFGGEVSISDPRISISEIEEADREFTASDIGTGRFARVTTKDRATQEWAIVHFTIPSDLPVGTYTITFGSITCATAEGENALADKSAKSVDFTVTGSEPVTPEPTNGYTVTIADDTVGTDEVNIGDTVTMNVTVDEPVNGIQATVSYNKDLFEYQGTPAEAGKIVIEKWFNTATTNVASLKFTAKNETAADATGTFGFAENTNVYTGAYADFTKDAIAATVVTDSVKVAAKSYSISIADGIQNGTVKADMTTAKAGDTVTVTATPTDAEKFMLSELYYIAEGSTDKVTINNGSFQMPAVNVTIYATFEPIPAATYTITVPEVDNATVTVVVNGTSYAEGQTINGLTEGTPFTVSAVADNAQLYEVTGIKVLSNGSELIAEDGVYEVADGNIIIEVMVAELNIKITTYENYINGYYLVVAEGTNADGYTYAGAPMIKVADNKYAFLTKDVDGLVAKNTTGTACDDIADDMTYDVNDTGKIDFNDAGAAFGCMNEAYNVAEYMAMYLRADVGGDNKVDIDDVSEIMNNYTK